MPRYLVSLIWQINWTTTWRQLLHNFWIPFLCINLNLFSLNLGLMVTRLKPIGQSQSLLLQSTSHLELKKNIQRPSSSFYRTRLQSPWCQREFFEVRDKVGSQTPASWQQCTNHHNLTVFHVGLTLREDNIKMASQMLAVTFQHYSI